MIQCMKYVTRSLERSIKSAEQQARGDGNRCILKNSDTKVPYDIDFFCL